MDQEKPNYKPTGKRLFQKGNQLAKGKGRPPKGSSWKEVIKRVGDEIVEAEITNSKGKTRKEFYARREMMIRELLKNFSSKNISKKDKLAIVNFFTEREEGKPIQKTEEIQVPTEFLEKLDLFIENITK